MADVETMTDEQLLLWKPRMGLMTVAEKIEQAETLKRQANLHFKRNELKKALAVYAKVQAACSLSPACIFAHTRLAHVHIHT